MYVLLNNWCRKQHKELQQVRHIEEVLDLNIGLLLGIAAFAPYSCDLFLGI
jgi:hypothetical protein